MEVFSFTRETVIDPTSSAFERHTFKKIQIIHAVDSENQFISRYQKNYHSQYLLLTVGHCGAHRVETYSVAMGEKTHGRPHHKSEILTSLPLSLGLLLSLLLQNPPMASSSSLSLVFLIVAIVGSAIGGASARPGLHFHPCNTLFISFTTISSSSEDPNRPSAIFAIYRQEFNRFDPSSVRPSDNLFLDSLHPRPEFPRPVHFPSFPDKTEVKPQPEILHPVVRFPSFGASSLRDRTKDILSVVLALLFGVGCGALTSATMYLVWSVVTSRYESQDSDGEDGEDNVGVNDMGYVKIPAEPVKEGYEGK